MPEGTREIVRVALLQYIVSAHTVQVSVLKQDGSAVVYLLGSAQEIFPKVDALLAVLNGDHFKAFTKRVVDDFALDWGRYLLPAEPLLDDIDVLVIIPQHTLHAVPFHLIHYGGEAAGCRFGIAYNTSVSLFRQCVLRNKSRIPSDDAAKSTQSQQHRRDCVCVSSDVTDRQNEYFRSIANSFASHFGGPLLAADSGARLLIKNLTPSVTDPDYSKDVDVLCVVSHGHISEVDQDESGLLLKGLPLTGPAPERRLWIDEHSYILRDYPFCSLPPEVTEVDANHAELFAIRELKSQYGAVLELVTLFGCSTGVGSLSSSDEYNSLAHQWMKAGAASVVASTWVLDGQLLKDWSTVFAEQWQVHCKPKAVAWRDANRALRASYQAGDNHSWGVLSLFGDWY